MTALFNLLDMIAYIVAAGLLVWLLITYIAPTSSRNAGKEYEAPPGKLEQCVHSCGECVAEVISAIFNNKKDIL